MLQRELTSTGARGILLLLVLGVFLTVVSQAPALAQREEAFRGFYRANVFFGSVEVTSVMFLGADRTMRVWTAVSGISQPFVQNGRWAVQNNVLTVNLTRADGQTINVTQTFRLQGRQLVPVRPTTTATYTQINENNLAGLVTGTVTYRERRALTPGAVVIVRLIETNGVTRTIAEQRITNPGQVPVPFVLQFDPALINANRQYYLQAQILEDNRVIFTNQQPVYVITRGRDAFDVEVVVGAGGTGTAAVSGTIVLPTQRTLPANSSVRVLLVDITRPNAPAVIIGEQTITQPRQSPFPFSITYDPNRITAQGTYIIIARVIEGGRVTYYNTRSYAVITQGRPTTNVTVLVDPVEL